jgi:hypothetical protein
MERIEDDGKISFKKIGGGALRWNKQLIKPGQIIRLNPNDIPKNFLDVLIPLEKIREVAEPPIVITKSEFKVVPRGKSKSLFDVLDNQGKVINEKGLTKEVAESLVNDLSK